MLKVPGERDEPERPGVILKLADRLISLAPPKLSTLIVQIGELENLKNFIALIKEILPEREKQIMAGGSVAEQMRRFVDYFQDRYFPLDESFIDMILNGEEEESYGQILAGIPVQDITFDAEQEYHEVAEEHYRLGCQLATFLVENPWGEDDEGAWLAIGEACARAEVSRSLLTKVPNNGFKYDKLSRYLEGTKYEPLRMWAKRMYLDTGNFFLDRYLESCGCGMGYMPTPPWSRENVEELTKEWKKSEEILEDWVTFMAWLEDAPEKNFKEVLDFILRKERENAEDEGSGESGSEQWSPRIPVEAAETPEQRTLSPGQATMQGRLL